MSPTIIVVGKEWRVKSLETFEGKKERGEDEVPRQMCKLQ